MPGQTGFYVRHGNDIEAMTDILYVSNPSPKGFGFLKSSPQLICGGLDFDGLEDYEPIRDPEDHITKLSYMALSFIPPGETSPSQGARSNVKKALESIQFIAGILCKISERH